MDISFLGAGCVKISGRQVTIICDPYGEAAGLGKIKGSADIVTLSAPDMTATVPAKLVLDGPGEYEKADTMVTGAAARLHIDAEGTRGTIYIMEVDGVNVAVTGNIAPGLSSEQLEAMGQVDVLVVPVGGHGLTLDAKAAAELVSQLEPKYVIPVHFGDDKTNYPMPQEPVEAFLKEMGATPEPQTKLKIQAKAEMPLETEVVLLKRAE